MESPDGDAANAAGYADFVVDGVLHSGLTGRFAAPTLVLGGERVVAHLRGRYHQADLELRSLSHEESIVRLSRAAVVLTAPGLTTALECFQLAVPTFFLPPQNYSQWWSLQVFRARELAPGAFHWQDRLSESPIVERMPEATRGPLLRAIIDRLVVDESARSAYADSLEAVPTIDGMALAARQRAFFESLGSDGVATVTRQLAELVE
jgi:hypothetical protein